VLAACAAQTSRILLGTGITSVFVRTAPTIAMAALTVDDLSRGRFVLDVGSSHKVQVGGEHGMLYAKPLTRVRETVALIRRLAQNGRVRFQGETVQVENFDLWFAPLRRTFPIYLSAVFPKMAALGGEIADRNHPDPQHARHGPRDQKQLGRGGAAGWSAAGRGDRDLLVAPSTLVLPSAQMSRGPLRLPQCCFRFVESRRFSRLEGVGSAFGYHIPFQRIACFLSDLPSRHAGFHKRLKR
jgi:alkanesulfonate monooxygenase SsuD/methylene tetrahydromethanopterin reductase-like flavin-dependent oxidoreductase (luciferase family)